MTKFDTAKAAVIAVLAFLMLSISASAQTDTVIGNDTPPALPFQADGPPDLPQLDTPPDLPKISYYIGVNGEKIGPLDQSDLTSRIKTGDLNPNTLVWTNGMDSWQKAETRTDLNALLAAVSTKPPRSEIEAEKFVVGKWTTSGTTTVPELGQARVKGTETYGADGTYSSVSEVVIDSPPAQLRQSGLQGALTLDVKVNGRYRITSQAGSKFSIEVTATVAITDRNGLGLSGSEQATETTEVLALDGNSFKTTEDNVVARRVTTKTSNDTGPTQTNSIAGVWQCEHGISPRRQTNSPSVYVAFKIELNPNGTMRATGVANQINQFQAQGQWVLQGKRFTTKGQMKDALGQSPFAFSSLVTSNTTMNEQSSDQKNSYATACQKAA